LVVGYLGMALFIINISTMIGGMVIIELRGERNPLTSCPHCAKPLGKARYLIFATQHCPYCSQRVIAEPNDSGEGRITADHLNSGGKALKRLGYPIMGLISLFLIASLIVLGTKTDWGKIASILLFLLAMLVGAWGAWTEGVMMKRNVLCTCIHCSKSLLINFLVVIATRNCCHCGRRVLTGPADSPPNHLVLDDLNAFLSRYQKRFLMVLGISVPLLIGGVLAETVLLLNNPNFLQLAEKPRWIAILLLCVPEIPGLLVLFLGMRNNHRMMKRDPRYLCPYCDASLYFQTKLVSITGNCCYCGRRVLAETEEVRQSEVNAAPK
jgi:hypothetical protein